MLRWIALVVAGSIIVAGCGSGGGFSKRASNRAANVFRYSIVTNPTTLDPHCVKDGDTIDMLQQVFESLVTWGTDSRVHPNVAEKWDIKDGGTKYVFTLKKGVKFHNGRECTAEDFRWSIDRATSKALASPVAASYLDDIVGVKEHLAGQADTVKGVQALDKYTLVIRIDKPRPYFLGKLTYLCAAALPKEAVPADKRISKVEEAIGTGPFKLASFAPEQLVVLEANKDFRDGKPPVDRIERPVLKDPATRLLKYKNGEIDLVQLERQDVASLQKDSQFGSHLKFYDRPAIWYVGFAPVKYPPFADRRVRQAFAMAIDKKTIVEELLGGVNKIANAILPEGVEGARPQAKALPYDPARARVLLAEAGYTDGKGLPPLEMNFRDSRADVKIVAEAVVQQLKQNLNVTVNARSMEWGAFLNKLDRFELQIYHLRWAADYLDPQNFLSLMLATGAPENKMGYSNKEFDALCARADTMPPGEERLKLYAQAEDLVLQDAPWCPIYFQRDAELINPRVKGLRESLFGHLPHTTVSVEP